MAEEEEAEFKKPLMIFGTDVTKIPCFRSSVMWGVGSGITCALVVFMLTSKPQLASHSMVGTFGCSTLVAWFYCRQRWAYNKFSIGQIHGAVRKAHEDVPVLAPESKAPSAVEIIDV